MSRRQDRAERAARRLESGPTRSLAGGPGVGNTTRVQSTLVGGPSLQSVALARTLALTLNTASPASAGRVWAGDPGFGVNRFEGDINDPSGGPVGRAIAPVAAPRGVVRGATPSFPTTGPVTGTQGRAVGMLDLSKLDNLGWK